MNESKKKTSKAPAFLPFLSSKERQVLKRAMTRVEVASGGAVFSEGELGDSVYVLQDGSVEVTTRISGDVEKTLLTLGPGGIFGELALITKEARTGTARALEDSVLFSMQAERFEKLCNAHPVIGEKMMRFLLGTMARRLNVTTELYRRAVAWDLNISGVIEMNFHQLITDHISITIELLTGKAVAGTLLKVEQGAVGCELLVKTTDDQFVIVPYAAVAAISFAETSE